MNGSSLSIRRVGIDTWRENVAYLHRDCPVVRAAGGCLAWGGTAALSPADDILISRPLPIDSSGQMVASILSKKVAAGSTHLVLDIPVGPSAKVRSLPEAQRLAGRVIEFDPNVRGGDGWRIARLSGAPQVPGAGVLLHHVLGDTVRQGEALYTLHAQHAADLEFARRMAGADSGFEIGPPQRLPHDIVPGAAGLA
jgi:thymidine phosphorylase